MVKLGDLLKDQASLNQLDNFMIMTASLCVITILKNYTYQIASSLRHKVSLASSHKPNNYNKKTHPHTCSITTNWSVVNMAFQSLLYHETGAGASTPLPCVWILGCMLASHYIITLKTFVLCGNIPDSFCISLNFFWYRNHQKDTLMSIDANIEGATSLTSQHVLLCRPQPT